MDRAEKRELVSTLHGVFEDTGVLVVAHYQGLTVAQISSLRVKMKAAGASLKVAKNRLAKIALQGTELEHAEDLFKGPTLIAYSADVTAATKVAVDFAKTNDKLVILGGALGKTKLDASGVKALATMPSLDELRARLIGMINTPATRIAGIQQQPGASVARVLSAYAKKDEAA